MFRTTAGPLALMLACVCALAKEMTDIEQLVSTKQTKCSYEHAFDMYGAHCAGLRLPDIPKNLKGGIEILDFSDNRLRELGKDTLSYFTSLRFLYLADNQIYSIHEDAFTYLTSLQTLDLSRNVIMRLPNSVFQLPSLRKMYLTGNLLMDWNTTDIAKPIKAPLELLDVSDCKVTKPPALGIVPQMIFYNISHNPLSYVGPEHFAPMCNLKKVDMSKSIERIRICEIKPAIMWMQLKNIFFQLDDAEYTILNSREFEYCVSPDMSETLNSTHKICKTEYLHVQNTRTSRKKWLTISGGLAGFLVGFILLLYVMHRHNVAQAKKATDKKAQPADINDPNSTSILLRDVS